MEAVAVWGRRKDTERHSRAKVERQSVLSTSLRVQVAFQRTHRLKDPSATVDPKFPSPVFGLVWVLLWLVETHVGLTKGAKLLVYP